jgi:AcrR family transcriptional regulator
MTPTSKRRYHSPLRVAQAEATRRRIVASALERFAAQGFGATSVAEIARAAGVAPETIYGTFGTKQGVLVAIADMALEERFDLAAFRRRHAEFVGRPRAHLRNLVDAIGEFLAASPDIVAVFGHAAPEATAAFEGFRTALYPPGQPPFVELGPGVIRRDVDARLALVLVNAILTPLLYARLVGVGGLGLPEFKRRSAELLEFAILDPAVPDDPWRPWEAASSTGAPPRTRRKPRSAADA